MKIPDRVYIPYEIGPGYDYISSHYYLGPTPKMENAEYLRKDALLEWAKEELSKASVSSDSIGRRNAFIDVVDKLNSM